MTAIERRLNDDERELLLRLAIHTLAEQNSATEQVAADALDLANEQGRVVIAGDEHKVSVLVSGTPLVTTARDWLAFHAAFPGNDPLASGRWIGEQQ